MRLCGIMDTVRLGKRVSGVLGHAGSRKTVAKRRTFEASWFALLSLVCNCPLKADTHAQWASEAFTSLVGSSGQLSIARLRGRSFSVWLRNFVNAMVLQGRLPPCKAMRTSHLAALLIAKARVNKDDEGLDRLFLRFTVGRCLLRLRLV